MIVNSDLHDIDASIISELPEIVFELVEGDNLDSPTRKGGSKYPIIKVSATTLNPVDIISFVQTIGAKPIPTLTFAFRDSEQQFRETDYIDETTDIVTWLGMPTTEFKPIKMLFDVKDVQSKLDRVFITSQLRMPKQRFTIQADTVITMLEAFCVASGLGLHFVMPGFTDYEHATNYTDVTATEFIAAFCEDLGFQWYIDAWYRLCILDLPTAVDSHEDAICDIILYSGQALSDFDKDDQPVVFTNKLDAENGDNSQFMYRQWGYDYVNIDNYRKTKNRITFDKSGTIEPDKYQVMELEPFEFPVLRDLSKFYFETGFNPYLMPGETFKIEVYTGAGENKRITFEEAEAGLIKSRDQLHIEDLSKVYLLATVEYRFMISPSVVCYCSFLGI